MATEGKNVLVLGGGVGGLAAASDLRKKLGKEHKITVIDKSGEHISSSSSLWVMVGERRPEEIKKDLSGLEKKGIEFVNEEISKIDPENRIVKTEKGELDYDYLIISLGAELVPETVPGLADALEGNAYNIYELDGVVKLRDALKNFSRGDIVILICSLPFKCPAAPYETAFLLDHLFSKRGTKGDIKIKLFTPEALPMGVAGADVGNMIKGMLENMDIEHNFGYKVDSIDAGKSEISSGEGKTGYDLLIVVPPHRAPKAVIESGLTDNDWVPVDKNTFETKFKNVYAIGDVTKIKLPGEWKPGVPLVLPKAGVFAHYEAKVLADNIANEILGKRERVEYTGEGGCFIEIGNGKAGYGSGNFYSVPNPEIKMNEPSKMWHLGKVLFEKYWLSDSIFKKPMDVVLEKSMYGDYKRVRTRTDDE
ncbi:MAG: FAD/NAD(P)-binding oxidoreductase [Candidatus Hydrothermarchaeaceae archaeon]